MKASDKQIYLMQIISIKNLSFISFLLFHSLLDAQNKNIQDTISKVILCESKLVYPTEAEEKNISGTVIIAFDIDSNCSIINIRVEKGIGYGCDEAAINTLKKCSATLIKSKRKCTAKFNLRQPFTFVKQDDE